MPITSPSQESACNAIKELANYCVRVPAIRDALLSIPRCVNLVALNTDNACKVLEAVSEAIGTLQPGQHGPHIEAALKPSLQVLHAFAQDVSAACAASAAGGLLASAATHIDGVVRSVQARALGLDEGAAEAMVAEGRRNGGAVAWNPSLYRVAKVAPALVVQQLKRVVVVLKNLHVHREAVPVGAGLPTSDQLYGMPMDERDGAFAAAGPTFGPLSCYSTPFARLCFIPPVFSLLSPLVPPCAVWHKRADEVISASEASLSACIMGAIESSWPILEALVRSLASGDGVLEQVGAVWSFAMRSNRECTSIWSRIILQLLNHCCFHP